MANNDKQQLYEQIHDIYSDINLSNQPEQLKIKQLKERFLNQFSEVKNPNDLLIQIHKFFNGIFKSDPSTFNFECYNSVLFDTMKRHLILKPKVGTHQIQNSQLQSQNQNRICDAFFFPSKENEAKLIHYLNQAKQEVLVCVFTITNDDLAKTLLDLHKRKVSLKIISDDSMLKMKGSDVEELAKIIPTKIDHNMWVHMHNKYVVIDKRIVITGSFNWTKQAVNKNFENVLVLEDEAIALKYYQDFTKLWTVNFEHHWVGKPNHASPLIIIDEELDEMQLQQNKHGFKVQKKLIHKAISQTGSKLSQKSPRKIQTRVMRFRNRMAKIRSFCQKAKLIYHQFKHRVYNVLAAGFTIGLLCFHHLQQNKI